MNSPKQFYARPKQLLQAHLTNVGKDASQRLPSLEVFALVSGLLHDLGKYSPRWQAYLLAKVQKLSTPAVNHAAAGSAYAAELWGDSSLAIQLAIAGHHTGLHDHSRIDDQVKAGKEQMTDITIPEWLIESLPSELPEFKLNNQSGIGATLAIRVLFGALIDADRNDAANTPSTQIYDSLTTLRDRLASHVAIMPLKYPIVDEVRRKYYQECRQAAALNGIIELAGPCGVGKTLAMMQLALDHAVLNHKSRIIYVAPYNSILEQCAGVYRDIVGAENVLEHHSGFDPKDETEDEQKKRKLDGERWEHPIIATSAVMFFESLFSHKPRRCRKLPSLQNAIVLIDEVHTIPTNFLKPIIETLQCLVSDWGCTIILSSATQPDYLKLGLNPAQAIDNPDLYYKDKALERVQYKTRGKLSWKQITEEIAKEPNGLIVSNTTAMARDCYQVLRAQDLPNVYHLSALIPPIHRAEILAAITSHLEKREKVYLSSTQVVEAGVDLDFAVGYRAMAGIDSIIQTAGRVNRNGKNLAVLNIFSPVKNYPIWQELEHRINCTNQVLDDKIDIHAANCLKSYSRRLYDRISLDTESIIDLSDDIALRKIGEKMQMITETQSVLCAPKHHQGELDRLRDELANVNTITPQLWKSIQKFSINMRPNKYQGALKNGLIEVSNDISVWVGEYDMGVLFDLPVGDRHN
jgi:CRISPR-associated endonuclease/helicase Cas3